MLTLLLILIPLSGALLLLSIKNEAVIKRTALFVSLLQLAFTLYLFFNFNNICYCKLSLNIQWISSLGINFHIALDGISLLLVLLTNILSPIIILAGFERKQIKVKLLYALILLMQSALIGVFVSLNAILFYIFWELALIPIYFIVLIWGGERRNAITLKFFIYTLLGSLFMLLAFIFLYKLTPSGSFELNEFYALNISKQNQSLIFFFMLLAFAIKMPLFPFHTWQPDTYTTAPTQGSMLLSGIMLKMGIYGAIRWLLPVTPIAVAQWGNIVIIFAISGIVYASFLALKQKDLKMLIAYSSIAHVGLMAAGIFAVNIYSLQGVIIQMFAHGIFVVGLFYVADIIENRTNTRQIDALGGIRNKAGNFTIMFYIILLGSIALPITNSFIGEFFL
ncbi:MAG: NADH-quinone oxidoreductase subunit M, partial [Bacteroidetes bacterium]|nr:NADH-quinone oxidoreductase subunit M [Bacteroidota bacterium]